MQYIETLIGTNKSIKTKPLTFLLALTFLFLFSGSVYGQKEVKKEYYDNGDLESVTHYKDGKGDGNETEWWSDGKKASESYWKNGGKEGVATFWVIGGAKWEEHWKNGKKGGLSKAWYESGKKKFLRHYKNGIEHGIRKEWDEDGKLTFQGNFDDKKIRTQLSCLLSKMVIHEVAFQ